MVDKIEGIGKVNQSQGVKATEQVDAAQEKFQQIMESKAPSIQPKFEVLDPKAFANSAIQSEIEFDKTHFNQMDVSSNKMGSATDEENKKGKQSHQESEEIEGVSSVSKTRSSKFSEATSSMSSQSISGENTRVSLEGIQNQNKETISKIEETKKELGAINQFAANKHINVEVKSSYQKILKDHLNHIDDNIRIASSKLGTETALPATTPVHTTNPIEKFISMLTDTQARMKGLQQSVESIAASGKITPDQMILLQIKSNLMSQEMDLFSSLLGKALEGIKSIMNVQV